MYELVFVLYDFAKAWPVEVKIIPSGNQKGEKWMIGKTIRHRQSFLPGGCGGRLQNR